MVLQVAAVQSLSLHRRAQGLTCPFPDFRKISAGIAKMQFRSNASNQFGLMGIRRSLLARLSCGAGGKLCRSRHDGYVARRRVFLQSYVSTTPKITLFLLVLTQNSQLWHYSKIFC
ncbi:hypothetical protein V7S43_002225 [Phytophthora oleae]|uniref:Uncharacterized protein n=1 Tax=Phytophthora oleae TaxID=2107226 RepID=A0ABD3G1T3_9STRA